MDRFYTRVEAIQHVFFVVDHHVDAHGFCNVGFGLVLAKDDAVEHIVQPVHFEYLFAFLGIVRNALLMTIIGTCRGAG